MTAIGTESEPIVFTSAKESKNKGDWAGIRISDNSILEHCIIEFAGYSNSLSGYNTALAIYGSTAVVNNCTIRESSGHGIEIEATGGEISFNTIQNCSEYGVTIDMENYQVFDQSNVMENSGGFYVDGDGLYEDITLEKRSYPYIVDGLTFFINATLTIEPGAEIQLRSGTGFALGFDRTSRYSGNLIANGTPEEPIKFSLYHKDKEAGNSNWGALVFGTESTVSVLENCIISDGGYVVDGNSNTHPNMGMIHCYKTAGFPTITNCTIANSATYGITLEGGATTTMSGNVFSNNASGDKHSY